MKGKKVKNQESGKEFVFPSDFIARVKEAIPLKSKKDESTKTLHEALDTGDVFWVGRILFDYTGGRYQQLREEYKKLTKDVDVFGSAKNPKR